MRRLTLHGLILATLLGAMAGADAQSRSSGKPVRGQDFIYTPAIGEGLCVQNLFQSNMVLQRDKPITVWGWARPGDDVTVTFDGKQQAATAAADRAWKVTFPALPASDQPRTMEIKGSGRTIQLENILIGEVWLGAGQSNMEFPIAKATGAAGSTARIRLKLTGVTGVRTIHAVLHDDSAMLQPAASAVLGTDARAGAQISNWTVGAGTVDARVVDTGGTGFTDTNGGDVLAFDCMVMASATPGSALAITLPTAELLDAVRAPLAVTGHGGVVTVN